MMIEKHTVLNANIKKELQDIQHVVLPIYSKFRTVSKKMGLMLLIPFLMSTTCIYKSPLIIKNELDKDIYVFASFDYPDTTLAFIDPSNVNFYLINEFAPNSIGYVRSYSITQSKNWRSRPDNNLDSIFVFILEKKSVDANNWDEFIPGDKYLRRYTLSYKDITSKKDTLFIR